MIDYNKIDKKDLFNRYCNLLAKEVELKRNWNDKTEDEVYLKMSKETLVKTINNKRNALSYLRIQRDELQARIDKAIEYIENSDKYDFSKCELLDILKGSDSNDNK